MKKQLTDQNIWINYPLPPITYMDKAHYPPFELLDTFMYFTFYNERSEAVSRLVPPTSFGHHRKLPAPTASPAGRSCGSTG
jgi:hypothetical protein